MGEGGEGLLAGDAQASVPGGVAPADVIPMLPGTDPDAELKIPVRGRVICALS